MELNLKPLIKQISKEKDLDEGIIKEAVEQAIITASKKSLSQFYKARPVLDMESGELKIFVTKIVSETVKNDHIEISVKNARKLKKRAKIGDTVEIEVEPTDFGRIAAQTVKQIIMQKLREAERDKIYDEYSAKSGNIVTGIVQRFVKKNIIVNIGKAEGMLPMNEIPRLSKYRFGDRIKVYIYEVKKSSKGPQIMLSRTKPELVMKLFEQEVPEISDGIVQIVAIAREAGYKSKIAVLSNNADVDPVGACVGMKGSRVQMIVRELENEKIDIVPYSNNPAIFIKNALNPAEIVQITIFEDTEPKTAEVVVKKESLSVAIGKLGLNARLASKLTGYKIDLKSDDYLKVSKETEEIQARYLYDLLTQIEDLPEISREAILKSQYNSVEKLAVLEPKVLYGFTNDNHDMAIRIIDGAKEYLDALNEMNTKQDEEVETQDEAEEEITDENSEANMEEQQNSENENQNENSDNNENDNKTS